MKTLVLVGCPITEAIIQVDDYSGIQAQRIAFRKVKRRQEANDIEVENYTRIITITRVRGEEIKFYLNPIHKSW